MIQYNPNGIFEQNTAKGGVCLVKRFMVAVPATTPTDLVALITTKKIVLLELNVRSNTAVVDFALFSNATAIFKEWALYQARNFWECPVIGLTETVVGQKLACTCGAASGIEVQGSYIEVVP